jgi:hypothetical protein
MTITNEGEWNTSDDPQRMLDVVLGNASDRKLRLYSIACVKRVVQQGSAEWWFDDAVALLHTFERSVHGNVDEVAYRELGELMWELHYDVLGSAEEELSFGYLAFMSAMVNPPIGSATRASLNANIALSPPFPQRPERYEAAGTEEAKHQAHLLRCIFGNPFTPTTFDSRWLTSTVKDLARTADEGELFDRLPILADALQDAGCENEAILRHCREDAVHARGCWVLDAILGK